MQRPGEDTWCPALSVETCSLSHPTAGLMAGKPQWSSYSALKGTVESRAEDTALYMVAGIETRPSKCSCPLVHLSRPHEPPSELLHCVAPDQGITCMMGTVIPYVACFHVCGPDRQCGRRNP